MEYLHSRCGLLHAGQHHALLVGATISLTLTSYLCSAFASLCDSLFLCTHCCWHARMPNCYIVLLCSHCCVIPLRHVLHFCMVLVQSYGRFSRGLGGSFLPVIRGISHDRGRQDPTIDPWHPLASPKLIVLMLGTRLLHMVRVCDTPGISCSRCSQCSLRTLVQLGAIFAAWLVAELSMPLQSFC